MRTMNKKVLLIFIAIAVCLSMFILASCDVSDDGANQGVPATHIHSYGEWELVYDATCEEEGIKKRYCVEKDDLQIEVIPAKGHQVVFNEVKAATCTETGLTEGAKCSICGKVMEGLEVIPMLPHDLIHHDGKAATCLMKGWKEYDTCANCDYTTYEEIAALGHDIVSHDAKAATCLAIGWEAYDTCTRCDYTTYEEIAALGHDTIQYEAQAPGCVTVGWSAYEACSRCDYSTYSEIAALGHDYIHHDGQAVSCTAIGWNEYDTCSRCDYSTYQVIGALGHDIAQYEAKAPGCVTVGWSAYEKCSRCDYSTYSEIAALGHDLEHHAGKAVSCTANGWNEYDTCTRCDYSTYQTIVALGHDIIQYDGQAATCTSVGWEAYEACSRCDYSTYVEIAKIAHTPVIDNAIAPGCETIGYTAGSHCGVCNTILTARTVIPAVGHAYEITDSEDATCTADGYVHSVCTVCSKEKTDILVKLGHNLSEYEEEIPATCTENGVLGYYYCDRCEKYFDADVNTIGDSEDDLVIVALGHNIIHHAAIEANCSEAGNKEYYYCDRCEKYFTTAGGMNETTLAAVTVAALGHDYRIDSFIWTAYTAKVKYVCHRDNTHIAYYDAIMSSEVTIAPSCVETGLCTYTATYEGNVDTKTEVVANLGHVDANEDGFCDVCTVKISRGVFVRVDADGEKDDQGGFVQFGSYPQSKVTDVDVIAALNEAAGELPTEENAGEWTSYGYYVAGEKSDYMWYIDLSYGDEEYRGVYFTALRPYFTDESTTANSYQDDNGYFASTVYWFLYEPITWRIVSEENGTALVLCETIIDSQAYQDTIDGAEGAYANTYEYSTIRSWLNSTFYNTAFNAIEKKFIRYCNGNEDNGNPDLIDNSARSANLDTNAKYWNSGKNIYADASDDTADFIFLLSEQEVTKEAYGFEVKSGTQDALRRKATSDYAQSQGAYTVKTTGSAYYGNGWWWLRSPSHSSSVNAHVVYNFGTSSGNRSVDNSQIGVVPALYMYLVPPAAHNHEAGEWIVVTEPSCTHTGLRKNNCVICGALTEEVLKKVPHNFVDGVCSECGQEWGLILELKEDDTYEIVGYTGDSEELIISGEYMGKSITSIGARAFNNNDVITDVVLPDTITEIGDRAFSNCENLLSIIMPEKIDRGTDVFRDSINVEIIIIHNVVLVEAKEPTCTEEGNIEYYRCVDCGYYFEDAAGTIPIYDVTIPKTHNFVDGRCTECGTIQDEVYIIGRDNIGALGKFALGTLENAIGLPSKINVYTADGMTHELSVIWDMSVYDKSEMGTYTLTGYIQAEGYIFSDTDLATVETKVDVVNYINGTADIVFVIDISNSMGDEITRVKNNINAFAQALENEGVSARWALITFSDYEYSEDENEQSRVIKNGASEWYTDVNDYKQTISTITLADGGDIAETTIDGLMLANTLTLRQDARPFCILLTDATYKIDNHYGVVSLKQATTIMDKNDYNISVITTSDLAADYSILYATTGGICSDIAGDFSQDLINNLVPIIYNEVME